MAAASIKSWGIACRWGIAISGILVLLVPKCAAFTEREILTRVYDHLSGDLWEENDGWVDPDTPVCQWYGVTCDGEDITSNTGVTDLDLSYNNLAGKVPIRLWKMPSLRKVNFKGNSITNGGFHGMATAISPINIIIMSENSITKTDGISDAPDSLHRLHLTSNRLQGPFHSELFEITSVRLLYLSFNEMTGDIPTTIGNMQAAREIYCYGNQLSGTLPTEIGRLDQLEILTFAENLLSGTIPTEINNMHNLRTFSVHNLEEDTGVLFGRLPDMSDMVFLNELLLGGNEITGPIPDNFLSNSYLTGPNSTDGLMTIDLSYNEISGTLSKDLARFENLNINLVGNKIRSIDEELCDQDRWMGGRVLSYGCDAILCEMGYAAPGGLQKTDDEECEPCTNGVEDAEFWGSTDCDNNLPVLGALEDWEVLVNFYLTLGGFEGYWWNTSGWEVIDFVYLEYDVLNTAAGEAAIGDYCRWLGVTCNDVGDVKELILPDNGLTGLIPESLWSLPSLTKLDLSENDVAIDEDGNMTHVYKAQALTSLSMGETLIGAVDGIGQAMQLKELNLDSLYLDDLEMPDEFFDLVNLESFSCQWCGFTGTLPTGVKQWDSMQTLNLMGNEFSGALPAELGKLVNVRDLDLSNNFFSGPLPPELNDLVSLESLEINQDEADEDSSLNGTLLPFNKQPNLQYLSLASNNFEGKIPSDFLDGVVDTDMEIGIDLSYNELTGSIPEEMARFTKVNIDLVGNQISEMPDVLCNLTGWMDGEVGNVGQRHGKLGSCDAILCKPGSFNRNGRASTTSDEVCADCTDFSQAQFYGTTVCPSSGPVNHAEMNILNELYRATGGKNWKVPDWISKGVPICEREGVTCDDSDARRNAGVIGLDLSSMGLTGSLPLEDGGGGVQLYQLPKLEKLILHDNAVEVSFAGIGEAQNLKELHLTNTKVPPDLDGIELAPPTLKELHLAKNNLKGRIPDALLGLSQIEELYLNYNRYTGTMPTEFLQMESLKELWMLHNDITGHIPSFIGNMTKLKGLMLSENMLSGFIPTEFGELADLQRLWLAGQRSTDRLSGPLYDFASNNELVEIDLHGNALTGTVPATLLGSLLTFLKTSEIKINLSQNQLTGDVPVELKDFTKLYIDLAGNMIESLPDDLCQIDGWMEGKVGELNNACDAILCMPGTYLNNTGFQTDASTGCEPCSSVDEAPHYGSMNCVHPKASLEKEILEKIYGALDGPHWKSQDNWMTERNVCSWYGVACGTHKDAGTDHKVVVGLNLESNNIERKSDENVSSFFFALPYLTELNLEGNPFQLDFRGIGEAPSLETLRLSDTELSDITGIGEATKLRELHLTDNKLSAELPKELFKLGQLETLYLSFNKFSGTIPTEVGNLAELKEFYAYGNQLTGTLPTEIGQMGNIVELVLANNRLSGPLPVELENLKNMEQLSLYKQHGPVRFNGQLLSFTEVTRLWYLDLTSNDMEGAIPEDFMSNSIFKEDGGYADLGYEDADLTIYLSFNQLTGTVPIGLDDFRSLDLGLVGNRIVSIPQELCNDDNSDWMNGNVGVIQSCDAIMCPAGFFFNEIGRQEQSGVPCSVCPGEQYLGMTQCIQTEERSILESIYEATQGDNWDSSHNWMKDDVPICSWQGVDCTLGNAQDDKGVTGLDLSGLGLDGTLPSEVFTLPRLNSLSLQENEDLYMTFDGIKSAERLHLLYLSETGIEEISGIGGAPQLKELHITGNLLTGEIPDDLFDLSTLEELYFGYNSFSGTLSTLIGRLTDLVFFYAFDNELSGTIPSEVGGLDNLRHFVVAENLFSGKLPSELSSMPSLRLFSSYRRAKSGPKLEGSIPAFDNVPLLTDLYLDYNSLHGSIPTNFLSSSSSAALVTLSHNHLTGAVPGDLDNIYALNIQLEGNLITKLPNSLCDNDEWMDGAVGEFQTCDAILCPPGEASEYGRQNTSASACTPCDEQDGAPYFGTIDCGITLSEIEILKLFYDRCGGENWWNRDNWYTNAHICDWYGITCTTRKTVQSIHLGANNIVGTPPAELFDLPELRSLWLHSNPMSFSFVHVAKAKRLTDLRLDSTGLTSVGGIGGAESLVTLDLRFNQLKGNFPQEILTLVNLKSLSLADNELEGILGFSFGSLEKLRTLRLGSNRFSGPLPAFDDLHRLKTLDVSDNALTGQIPSAFLDEVASRAQIQVDLSSNQLTGTIPVGLDRFKSLTIYLRENKFTALPNDLCDNEDWNEGDVKVFGCNGIVCPPGTYSQLGRQTAGDSPCQDCEAGDDQPYFGQIGCDGGASANDVSASSTITGTVQNCFVVLLVSWLTSHLASGHL